MVVVCYRYEDDKGFGPYYNERKHIYNWKDDGWRYACDSLNKLEEWWGHNKKGMHLENYHLVKYIVEADKKFLFKIKETHMVDFKLTNVLNKEIIRC